MDSAGLRWYRTGTVNITQGSTNITGVGTNWRTAGIQPGDVFMVGNSVLYEIAQVADNTNIVLNSVFQGATGTGQNYSIIRNFAGTMQAQIAAQVSELVNKYESYIDTELQQIVGPPGPTSFPYRGTWATGREYDALDVVEFGGMLYIAIAGHISTSTNAPGAPETEWAPLQMAAITSQDVENMIQGQPHTVWAYSGDANQNTRGSINCHPTGMDIRVKDLPYAYDQEQFSVYDDKLQHFRHFADDGWVSQHVWTPDDDTGYISLRDGLYLRRKNGIVIINFTMHALTFESAGLAYEAKFLEIIPAGSRPFTDIIFTITTDNLLMGQGRVTYNGNLILVLTQNYSGWVDGFVSYFL